MSPEEFEKELKSRILSRNVIVSDASGHEVMQAAVKLYTELARCKQCSGKRVTEHANHDAYGTHYRVCDACKGSGDAIR